MSHFVSEIPMILSPHTRPTYLQRFVWFPTFFSRFGERINFLFRAFRRVSHTKTSLVGTSISIPITGGRLNLGTWQGRLNRTYWRAWLTFDLSGIYLTEFRHMPHSRRVVATILFVNCSTGWTTLMNDASALKSDLLWSKPCCSRR